ncbi:MAG: hypothetical protein HYU27_07720 [Acidobacteria bacterium]|nr:hypothetical protein [Acidobacteriota bacterium]
MECRPFSSLDATVTVLTLHLLVPPFAVAQGSAVGQSSVSTEPARIIRTADGQPDIRGTWLSGTGQGGYSIEVGDFDIQRAARDGVGQRTYEPFPSLVIDPTDGNVPYQPWALSKRNERTRLHADPPSIEWVDTSARCFLYGMPHRMYRDPMQITHQFPEFILMQWERDHDFRIIRLDGRAHIPDNVKLWNGDSRGRWEGNTLVVDVTNLNGLAWLDVVGDFVSDNAHIEERFMVVNGQAIDYRAIITDPTVFTRPWTIGFKMRRSAGPSEELWERACLEGNRSLEHMIRKR